MSVVAGGPPEQAAPFRRDRIEWLDHLEQGEPPGVHGEPEPAPLAPGGGENPLPGEAVERLREVVAGHAEHIGELVGADQVLIVTVGQVERGPQGILGGL